VALTIAVGVAYDADLEHVERVLVDEAKRAVGQIEGLPGDPPPTARLIPGFGAYSLDFTLACWITRFPDQFVVQHELRRRVLKRLRAEGIEIPFPTAARLGRSE
jgi:small-conductance mechanosensitive channel